jgi:glycosyltransferase involved in cell wall biosynthesis
MTNGPSRRRHLAFAAMWGPDPETTWSGTPFQLRAALRERAHVEDVGVELPPSVRTGLKLAHARPTRSGIVTSWSHSALTDRVVARRLVRHPALARVEAVLQIQDLAVLPVPYLTYQDMSFGALQRLRGAGHELTHFPALSARNLAKRTERQAAIYAQAAGVLCMSRWLAAEIELDGVDPSRIHVVHPGRNTPVRRAPDTSALRGPFRDPSEPRSLLFLGRDFFSKGGDLVVSALASVRSRYRSDTQLLVAGPRRWPLPTPPPPGVSFLGEVPQAGVARLLDACDLLVMPSRFEGFGIVFAEALIAGRPCVARRAFAMPEIVRPGETGRLVDGDDISELADAICESLVDEALFDNVWTQRSDAEQYWSWGRAADEVLAALP